MRKKLNIIDTKSHGYVLVDDSEIKEGDFVFCPKEEAVTEEDRIYQVKLFDETRQSHVIQGTDEIWYSRSYGAKLIATSTEHKIEGVLQYVIVDDIKLPYKFGEISTQHQKGRVVGYEEGFKAAKEKYPFSEEDVKKAFCQGITNMIQDIENNPNGIKVMNFSTLLESLKQPTLPETVEIEYEEASSEFNGMIKMKERPKLNSQGLIEIH